jgi:hypothetical protein
MTTNEGWRYLVEIPIDSSRAKKIYGTNRNGQLSLLNIYCDAGAIKDEKIISSISKLIWMLNAPHEYLYAQLLNPFESIEKILAFLKDNNFTVFDKNFSPKEKNSKKLEILTIKCSSSNEIFILLKKEFSESIAFFYIPESSITKEISTMGADEVTSQFERTYIKELNRFRSVIFCYHLHCGISLFADQEYVFSKFIASRQEEKEWGGDDSELDQGVRLS